MDSVGYIARKRGDICHLDELGVEQGGADKESPLPPSRRGTMLWIGFRYNRFLQINLAT